MVSAAGLGLCSNPRDKRRNANPKPGVHQQLLRADGDSQLPMEEVTTPARRLLVRCPGSLEQVDWKWQQFQMAHGKHDLRRVEEGLPFYKRERTIKFHIRNFFESTPAYILVAHFGELEQLLGEIVTWAKACGSRKSSARPLVVGFARGLPRAALRYAPWQPDSTS